MTQHFDDLTCPLCIQSKDFRPIFRGSHYVHQCPRCRLIFSDRVMDPAIFEYYHDDQEKFYERPYFQINDESVVANPDFPNYKKALIEVRDRLRLDLPRLLDVGS